MRALTFLTLFFVTVALAAPVEDIEDLDAAQVLSDLPEIQDFADGMDMETDTDMWPAARKVGGELVKHAPDFAQAVKDGIDKGNAQKEAQKFNQNAAQRATLAPQKPGSSGTNWANEAWKKYGQPK